MCVIFLFLVLPSLHLVSVVSPLKVADFEQELAGHPDQSTVSYVIEWSSPWLSAGVSSYFKA